MGKYTQRMRRQIAERAQMSGRNAYRCDRCHGYTVTLDVDRGTTPARLGCRATEGCAGHAVSLGYPAEWPAGVPTAPRWEWYRPDAAACDRIRAADPGMWQHVEAGGLLIRPRRKVHA